MLSLSKEEEAIHKLSFDKLITQYEAFYDQQNKMSYIMYKIAKLELINQVKEKNFLYAEKFVKAKNIEDEKDFMSSNSVVEFVHYMQSLINANNTSTAAFKRYLSNSNNNMSYLTIVEKARNMLHEQIDRQLNKKIASAYQAASIYMQETREILNDFSLLTENYLSKYKQLLIYNENNYIDYQAKIIQSQGYASEVSSLLTYMKNKSLTQAYKYQVPSEVESLTQFYNQSLEKFNFLVHDIFTKLKPKSKTQVFYEKMQKYIIEALEIIKSYQKKIAESMTKVRDKILEHDVEFIANSKIQAQENKKIIDKEYDSMAFQAIKIKDKRNKQISVLIDNSNNLNEAFKIRVKKINDEYLKEKNVNNDYLDYLEAEIIRIIEKNDKQLIKMLKLIDKEIFLDRVQFTKQYKKYLNMISGIRNSLSSSYNQEVKYLYDLNYKREADITKTIALLEEKIDRLPVQKESILKSLEVQKKELFATKQQELLQKFAEIEGNKLMNKPGLIEEIRAVEKRLPEDYIKLYRQVQELENEYLQQYTLINENYFGTYQDYINKQFANRLVIENDGKIFKSFDWLNNYHKDLLNIFQLNYSETLQKSIESRDIIKEEKQKSKDKQDRIINA